MKRHHRSYARTFAAGAFTLVELLVVIVIIGILAAISLAVATRVTAAGKQRLSQSVIRSLEATLQEYTLARGSKPESAVRTNQTQQTTGGNNDNIDEDDVYEFPLIDGRFGGRAFPVIFPDPGGGAAGQQFDRDYDPAQPTVALYLLAIEATGEADAMLKGIDPDLIQRRDVWAYGRDASGGSPTGAFVKRRLRVPVVLDGFGEPLRFVHPGFDGGAGDYHDGSSMTNRDLLDVTNGTGSGMTEFSRSYRPFAPGMVNSPNPSGDADEGICVGNTPYFYSAGRDKDPGTREDNAYGSAPQFPVETAELE